MDTAHWPQGIGIGVVDVDNKASIMEESSISAASRGAANNAILERKLARPQKDQALNCPRCNSTTTKFCYYNNYSLSQPRYFCKTCRRYWTEGGSLRNVPVGGGSRKNNKRPSSDSSSSPSSSSANKKVALHHGQIGNFASESPKINFQGQDLNLAYPPGDQEYDNNITDVPPFTIDNKSNYHHHHHQNPSSLVSSQHHNFSSAMELLKSGMALRGMPSFVPMVAVPGDHPGNVTMFGGGFVTMQEFKASGGGGGLGFSLGGFDQSGGFESTNNSSSHARLLFPSDQDLKQQINPSTNVTATAASEFDDHQQNGGGEERDSGGGGYWNGMLGGGSW